MASWRERWYAAKSIFNVCNCGEVRQECALTNLHCCCRKSDAANKSPGAPNVAGNMRAKTASNQPTIFAHVIGSVIR